MSKVVHLSDEAHAKAKEHCKKTGLRMSDWVAILIEKEVLGEPVAQVAQPPVVAPPSAPQPQPPQQRTAVDVPRSSAPRKKSLRRYEDAPVQKVRPIDDTAEEEVPAYAAPPFWSRAQN